MGLFSHNATPIFKPSTRPVADSWALSGPTSGTTMDSNRVWRYPGKRSQTQGATSTNKPREAPAVRAFGDRDHRQNHQSKKGGPRACEEDADDGKQ